MTSTDLYIEFFGFSERPFTLLPDPDFLFWSRAHRRAYSVLEYGVITRSPITVVTGEVGVGKTTLVQKLLQTLDDDVTLEVVDGAVGHAEAARVQEPCQLVLPMEQFRSCLKLIRGWSDLIVLPFDKLVDVRMDIYDFVALHLPVSPTDRTVNQPSTTSSAAEPIVNLDF